MLSAGLHSPASQPRRHLLRTDSGYRVHVQPGGPCRPPRESLSQLDIRQRGMSGRSDVPPLTVYHVAGGAFLDRQSGDRIGCRHREHPAHSRRRPVSHGPRRPGRSDREGTSTPAGAPCVWRRPWGTTSTTSVDPVPAIADVCRRFGVWLHVDAAYAWAAAILPEKKTHLRRLRACRLDRRQPAQMAVHARST